MPTSLPIIKSCDGCSACCRVVTLPPFRRLFIDQGGEEAWERLRWDRPDLKAEYLEAERARKTSGEPSFGTPCLWLDRETNRCRNYDHRPAACREFAVGSEDCLGARRRAGVS